MEHENFFRAGATFCPIFSSYRIRRNAEGTGSHEKKVCGIWLHRNADAGNADARRVRTARQCAAGAADGGAGLARDGRAGARAARKILKLSEFVRAWLPFFR